ncbi:MAG: HNH endonuclease [Halobacteriota archaeon]
MHVYKDAPVGGINKTTGRYFDGYDIDHIDWDYTNNTIENLRCVTHEVNLRNRPMQQNNTSGVTGVSLSDNYQGQFWVAYWNKASGKRATKSFSVKRWGYQKAFELACEKRNTEITLLRDAGLGYTTEHGSVKKSSSPLESLPSSALR